MKRLILIASTLALAGCFQDARSPADQARAEHFRQLDQAGISDLSGTQSRDPRSPALACQAHDVPAGAVRGY